MIWINKLIYAYDSKSNVFKEGMVFYLSLPSLCDAIELALLTIGSKGNIFPNIICPQKSLIFMRK